MAYEGAVENADVDRPYPDGSPARSADGKDLFGCTPRYSKLIHLTWRTSESWLRRTDPSVKRLLGWLYLEWYGPNVSDIEEVIAR